VLDQLECAIDELCGVVPARLAGGDTIEELHRQLERLTAVVTRAVAAFDATRSFEADGARSAAAWIAGRCRGPLKEARHRVRLGREVRHLPATEAAWLEGGIGEAHVKALASARRRAGGAAFDPDETMLVGHARTLQHRDFVRVVEYWVQVADPEGVEKDAEAQRSARRVHLSPSYDGMWFLDGLLDPLSGEIVSTALRRIEDELFMEEWAEHKEAIRTPAQRRADALVEMARRAGAVPPGGRLPAPLLSVFVGYETLAGRICQLASGTVVTPGSLLPWLTDAYVERVVFDGPDRVKNVGERRRLFTGATRRAVEVRDRECFHDLCDQPAVDCQIDHVQPYGAGGPTTDDNGRPACPFHNRRRHERPPP